MVGGGIAGLAAAWELRDRADVTVFEPARLGGKLQTETFLGHLVDMGADAFIARVPEALALCEELGIDGDLVAPSATKALLWAGGRLRPLPDGLVLGVPGRLGPLLRSGILTPAGIVRASLDLVLPRTEWPDDLAVADLVAARFGRQVADRLVDPLLGGIHAGRTDRLSVEATAPQLATAARRSRSLLLGLRRSPSPAPGPVFLAPRLGMQALVDRLVAALAEVGVGFVREEVVSLDDENGGLVRLEPGGAFDRVVLAVPAATAAKLIKAVSPEAAAGLGDIRTASVALATLAYPAGLPIPQDASGFLVPRGEGRLMTACSFGSRKWPHWSDPDTDVLRVSAGRAGDDRPFELDDERLVERLDVEVSEALHTTASPSAWRVSRWPGAFPQYAVGHLRHVATIDAALRRAAPHLALAGASYRGSGIPACIASGRRGAALLVPPPAE
ncbi:MAG TPA: protoporphyrinogen oxidase [Acidimicrobiales bacterium]|nr:protoporphyrinogen oxidase [Acidimicrobiales bacterium]